VGFLGNLLGTNSNYQTDENYMNPWMQGSANNNMQLQSMLMDQAKGGGPNLADEMNRIAVGRNQAAAASTIGSMKGISPAASMRAIANAQGQAGADAAGQASLTRMQQQLEAQRMLGVNSMGMTGIGVQGKGGAQGMNAQTAAGNAKNNSGLVGGLIGGAATGLMMGMMNKGGVVGMADGGAVALSSLRQGLATQNAIMDGEDVPSFTPPMQRRGGRGGGGSGYSASQLPDTFEPNLGGYNFAGGGQVPDAGPASVMSMRSGGMVPGRAPVTGDSPRNDIVPAALSPGEVVLPRTVAQHPNAPQAAYDFVAALRARGGR
jgi:hypothetical protein